MARPPTGTRQVQRLEGDAQAKERLRIVLETIAGQRSVVHACHRLGVGKTRFHALRQQALQAALDGMEPGVSGRPRAQDAQEAARVRDLQEQVDALKLDLQAALVRTELALTLPNVLRRTLLRDSKKNGRATTD